jgi:hypothetical protein
MAPFLCNALFDERSTNPLELIILAREAATKFDACHKDVAGFADVSAADRVKAFTNWALAIHLGRLREARVSLDPDNCKLQAWAITRNESCILSATGASGGVRGPAAPSREGHFDNETFKILGKGLKRMGEAADEANVLKRKEIKQRDDESEQKKDRIKDMHPSILNMILMASSVDSKFIGEYTESFKLFFNSKTQGYADLELHHQFEDGGIHNVGFAEGTVLVLYSGHLKRSNPTTPSNCTPFAFRELQAAQLHQKSRLLVCTMINHKGGSTQSAKELKAKAKQDVVVPSDYNEMIFQLKAFAAMTDILFGEGSVVTKKLMRFICAINTNALSYKARAALDDFFPSKVLWAMCNRFQTFLTTCTHARDRDNVNNSIIEFTLDQTDIVLDRFSPTLPPCFKEVKNKVKIGRDADNENKNKKVKKSKK